MPSEEAMHNVWTAVDAYFGDRLVPSDSALDAALAANREAKLPAIDVTPLQGKLLELLVRITGAKRVLELGTLGGYSTLWLARALPEDGNVISLELDPRHAEVARSNFSNARLDKKIELRVGPAADELRRMIASGIAHFDLIFMDADKSGYPEYLRLSLELSRPGTVIFADNVVREGKVIEADNADPNIQGVRKFTELVAAEPRLSATVLQTVCGKGYDGFALALVLR